ncbi:MAG: FG-GAP-like repeat-containing protein [Bacteroidota bacterium]
MPAPRLVLLGSLALLPFVTAAQTPLESPKTEAGGAFGTAVAAIDDLNGDGVRDLIVGAPGESVGGASAAGRVYVLSGATRAAIFTLESPTPEPNGGFGRSLTAAGDLNGDDVPDLIVGAPGESVEGVDNAGRAYAVSGADGSVVQTLRSPTPTTDGGVGTRVVRLGDTNGDRVNDIGVAAAQDDPNAPPSGASPGAVFVFSGADGSLLDVERGADPSDRFGSAIGGSDLNRDGRADLVVGIPAAASVGGTGSGIVALYASGDPTRVVFEPPFPADDQEFGVSLAVIGDRDDDDVAEVLIGARDSVFVFSGGTGETLLSLGSPWGADGRFGLAVSGAGNVEETGAADLLVGAPFEDVSGRDLAGRIYIFSGDDGALIRTLSSPNAEDNGRFGSAVALAGEVDDDNTADQIVGAPGETVNGQAEAGRAYLLLSASVVSTEAEPSRDSLTVSPNPARGSLRLGVPEGTVGTLLVTDALGRVMHRGPVRNEIVLDVSRWAPGVYHVRLGTEAGIATTAVSVVR